MNYLSVCSGIEAATVAWEPLGWNPVAFSEIEPFCCALLKHYYPGVPNLGDMAKHKEWDIDGVDLIVGGTPCQSFSVAGLRKGMDDPRGNLALVYLGIVDQLRPRWLVWENVPGVLSSSDGRDFGAFLGALGELGYGWAYRVLDAQYFGVAQRRRRVFVVGCAGGAWQRAAAVLFERSCLSGHPAPRREAGEDIACAIRSSVAAGGRGDGCDQGVATQGVAGTLAGSGAGSARPAGNANETDMLVAHSLRAQPNPSHRADNDTYVAAPLVARQDKGPYLDPVNDNVIAIQGSGSPMGIQGVRSTLCVRRLTPTECERLQGFPDGYTAIPYKGKPADDGPRYRALGNSMAVPVMRWIGERIAEVEAIR